MFLEIFVTLTLCSFHLFFNYIRKGQRVIVFNLCIFTVWLYQVLYKIATVILIHTVYCHQTQTGPEKVYEMTPYERNGDNRLIINDRGDTSSSSLPIILTSEAYF